MAVLNTKWFKEKCVYSDGPVEDEMLEMVRSGKDLLAVLESDNRWPILYHFSPYRRNLLEWFPFSPDASLLEIGAGCGALTGLFCEKTAQVTAVELSERRSRILFHRHEKVQNLEVIAGNLADVEFPGRFDYVTLIGVLEYAGRFSEDRHAASAMLHRVGDLLAPGGSLILAMENKFGLKYFAGAREDHTGRSFDSIEGYPPCGIETFSRKALESLLKSCGYSSTRFYYPYPDYKLPGEVFSDDYLPRVNHILHDAPNYDQERLALFSEKKAFVNIVKNGDFPFFSNSFLVVASR